MIVTANFSGGLGVWDAATGVRRSEPVETGEGSVVVAVSTDGRFVATGGDSKVVTIRDDALRVVYTLTGHANWIRDLVFRPSDGALVSAGADGVAFLWTELSGNGRVQLTEPSSGMASVDISRDGRTVATGNVDGQLVLWDVSGREARRSDRPTQPGHDGAVTGVAFDPSGRWLVTGDEGGTLRLWEADPDLESLGVLGRVGPVEAIAAVPGRGALISVGVGGAVRWTVAVDEWRATACAVAGRNLGEVEAGRYGFDEAPRTCPGLSGD
jgi:WD40 repeat protein